MYVYMYIYIHTCIPYNYNVYICISRVHGNICSIIQHASISFLMPHHMDDTHNIIHGCMAYTVEQFYYNTKNIFPQCICIYVCVHVHSYACTCVTHRYHANDITLSLYKNV